MTTIKFFDNAEAEITAAESSLDTRAKIRAGVTDAVEIATAMANDVHARVDATMNHRWPRQKRRAWRRDDTLNAYFGDKASVLQIRAVRRRINRARRRLNRDKLRIRLLPQGRASNGTTNGHNRGGPFSPRTFVLFPSWFEVAGPVSGDGGREERAAIVLHELLHDWLIDQKLNGKTVSGDPAARELADAKPARARRNPENYEHLALNLRLARHGRLTELVGFRSGPRGTRRIPAGQRPRPGNLTHATRNHPTVH